VATHNPFANLKKLLRAEQKWRRTQIRRHSCRRAASLDWAKKPSSHLPWITGVPSDICPKALLAVKNTSQLRPSLSSILIWIHLTLFSYLHYNSSKDFIPSLRLQAMIFFHHRGDQRSRV